MRLTRKSFLKRVGAVLSSLLFWRPSTKAIAPKLDEFQTDGLKYIMWGIDREFGAKVCKDPWVIDREGDSMGLDPKWESFLRQPYIQVLATRQLFQKFVDHGEKKIFMMKWGEDDFSPEFSSENYSECWGRAIEWARLVPNSTIIERTKLVIYSA